MDVSVDDACSSFSILTFSCVQIEKMKSSKSFCSSQIGFPFNFFQEIVEPFLQQFTMTTTVPFRLEPN